LNISEYGWESYLDYCDKSDIIVGQEFPYFKTVLESQDTGAPSFEAVVDQFRNFAYYFYEFDYVKLLDKEESAQNHFSRLHEAPTANRRIAGTYKGVTFDLSLIVRNKRQYKIALFTETANPANRKQLLNLLLSFDVTSLSPHLHDKSGFFA
jgi:hypothetical protein